MRILTGYSPPTSGKAKVAGYDVFEQSLDVRKHVGYLPESVPLYRDMTAIGYLMYLAEIRGVPQRRSRAQDVLGRVGLSKRSNSEIRTLSKGMRQRVGLAAALIHDPEVLILDEPTIGLDPIQVLELRDLVSELGRNHTVMFSTHILSEAEQVCDKVVIINQGEVMAQGSPTELRAQLEAGQRILARVTGDMAAALTVVQGLDEVASASVDRGGIIAVPTNNSVDPRPAITRALVSAGHDVVEVRPAANNLEEIFLEVTRMSYAEDEAADEPEAVIVEEAAAAPTEAEVVERKEE
jgi:ABC-2 type transport system ATP-binding protein